MHDSDFLDQDREPMSSHEGPPDKPSKPEEMKYQKNWIRMQKWKKLFYLIILRRLNLRTC
jgi:hypothetical protein